MSWCCYRRYSLPRSRKPLSQGGTCSRPRHLSSNLSYYWGPMHLMLTCCVCILYLSKRGKTGMASQVLSVNIQLNPRPLLPVMDNKQGDCTFYGGIYGAKHLWNVMLNLRNVLPKEMHYLPGSSVCSNAFADITFVYWTTKKDDEIIYAKLNQSLYELEGLLRGKEHQTYR